MTRVVLEMVILRMIFPQMNAIIGILEEMFLMDVLL